MTKSICLAGAFAFLIGAGAGLVLNAPFIPTAAAQSSNAPEVEKMSPGKAKATEDRAYPVEVSLITLKSGMLFRESSSNQFLYVYDKDTPGKSACNEGCESVWPPLAPTATSKTLGDWKVIARDDGSKQWSYKGHPVYTRIHDSATDPTGDGVDGVWHFLKP